MRYSQKNVHEIFQATNKRCNNCYGNKSSNTSQHPNWTLGEPNCHAWENCLKSYLLPQPRKFMKKSLLEESLWVFQQIEVLTWGRIQQKIENLGKKTHN
jgi:hypothetical protein